MSAQRAAFCFCLLASLLGLAPMHASADEPTVARPAVPTAAERGPAQSAEPTVARPAAATEPRQALSHDAPITLRPEAALRPLALRAARVLATRTGVAVDVGEPPPEALIEAIPNGHVAIAMSTDVASPGVVSVVLAGREATFFDGQLRIGDRRGSAEARALAIAIESLRDAALTTELPATPPVAGAGEVVRLRRQVRLRSDGFPWSRYGADRLPFAKPTIYLRALLGLSTARSTFLIGPGTGLGLCISRHCVVIEGDLPLIPEERANDRYRVRYRFLNFSARFQFRPFQFGPFTPGLSFGLVTRIGTASLVGTDRSQTVTNLGLRATFEAALRIDRRFEVVVEAGLDLALSRAQFINRAGDVLALEDRWTPWAITGLRLRP